MIILLYSEMLDQKITVYVILLVMVYVIMG
jgi:hypothetical protein